MIHPLVLGTRRRRFADGAQASLQLVDYRPAKASLIATDEPTHQTNLDKHR
jgi:hypothetical protein